ncbi:MAG: FliH/SctL family protein [Arenicella sp.]
MHKFELPQVLALVDSCHTQRVFLPEDISTIQTLAENVDQAQRRVDLLEQQYATQLQERLRKAEQRGYEAGMQKASEELVGVIDQFLSVEQQHAKLVVQAVEKVLGEIPDHEKVTRIALTSLRELNHEYQYINVLVHPEVLTRVQNILERELAGTKIMTALRCVADETLTVTDCIIETNLGMIKASLSIQLDAIRHSLLRSE